MNANAVLVCLAVGFFALSFASPDLDDVTTGVKELVPLDIGEAKMHGLRFRRATCDLLSFNLPWGSLNHSACAAHCLAMRKGYRGGRCKDGVCHCRK